MEELGLADPSLDRVIALSYRLLGLISFLTAGPDEVRAWPIRDGSTGRRCRWGDPHATWPEGFIRAEVVAYEDLLALGSMAEARKAGRLRSEGKTYRSPTATWSRSCSANRAAHELRGERSRAQFAHPADQFGRVRRCAQVGVSSNPSLLRVDVGASVVVRVVVIVVVLVVGRSIEVGEEVLVLDRRHVDGGVQPVVRDDDEVVVALELVGDRLDQAFRGRTCPGPGAGPSGRGRRRRPAPSRFRWARRRSEKTSSSPSCSS